MFNTDLSFISMFSVGVMFLSLFLILYCFRNYSKTQSAVKYSLELQETNLQRLELIVDELRKSNYFLSALSNRNAPKLQPVSSELAPNSVDNSQNGKLYVGNVDYLATEEELAEVFSRFGTIEFVNIPVNRYTGKARGFGFVTFSSQHEAEQAIMLNGSEFKGRQIQVNFAKEKEQAME